MNLPEAETVFNAIARDDSTGFCVECGAEVGGTEPDREKMRCEACGLYGVFGAENVLFLLDD